MPSESSFATRPNTTEKMAHLNTILSAAASTAKPLIPFDEEDPMHMAHARFGMLLFYGGGASAVVDSISA